MIRKSFYAIMAIVLFLGWTGNGAALTYTETDNGDLSTTYVGILDLGTNTIAGELSADGTQSPVILDWDTFYFDIGAEMLLQSVVMSFTTTYNDLLNQTSEFAMAKWDLREGWIGGSVAEGPAEIDLLGSSPVELFPGMSGIGEGTWYMRQVGIGHGIGDSWNATWQMELTVGNSAPVPEPATMLLLGSGLIGLAGFRRKFKK